MHERLAELEKERQIIPGSPKVKGSALIIPAGLLARYTGTEATSPDDGVDAAARKRVEMLAMDAVMKAERALGCEPKDVSATKGIGHDIESKPPEGKLRFIEVKGRAEGATQVTLTTNEVRCAINTPDEFILAVAMVADDAVTELTYIRNYPFKERGKDEVATAFKLAGLLEYGGEPCVS